MPTLSSSIVKHSVATMREVEEALARQVLYGGDLLTNLLEITSVDEARLSALLAQQHDLPPGPRGALPRAPLQATRLITRDVASRHCIYPLAERSGVLEICVASPLAADVESDLCFLLGVRLLQRVAPRARVAQAIARDYGVPLDRRSARILARLEGDEDPHPSDIPPPMDLPLNLADVPRPPSVPPIAYPPATELPSLPPQALPPQALPRESHPLEAHQAETSNVPEVALRQLLQQSKADPDRFPEATQPGVADAGAAGVEPLAPEPSLPESAANPEEPALERSTELAPQHQVATAPESDAPRSIAPTASERLANLGRDVERWKTTGAKPNRRRGPYTSAMAEQDLLSSESRDDVLAAFFDFSVQYFEYAALFAVQGDLAEGRSASGAGATGAEVRRLGVPLDLPGALRSAKLSAAPTLLHLNPDGLDASLALDLQRPAAGAKLLLPISVRNHCVLILYGCDGTADIQLANIGPVLAFASLVNQALERLILRRKLLARQDLKRDLPSHLSEIAQKRARSRTEGHAEQPSAELRASALVSALNAPKRPSTQPAPAAEPAPSELPAAEPAPSELPAAEPAPSELPAAEPPAAEPESRSEAPITPSRTVSIGPAPSPAVEPQPEVTANSTPLTPALVIAIEPLPETTASPRRQPPLPVEPTPEPPSAGSTPQVGDHADNAEPPSEPIPLSKPRQSKPRQSKPVPSEQRATASSKTALLGSAVSDAADQPGPRPHGNALGPALDAKQLAQRADEARATSKAKLKKSITPAQGTPSSVSQMARARRAVLAPNSKRVPLSTDGADAKLAQEPKGSALSLGGQAAQRRSEPPVFPLTRRSGTKPPEATGARDFVPEPEIELSEDHTEDISADSVPIGPDQDGPEISVSSVDERVSYPDEDFLDEAPLAASSRRMSVAPRAPVAGRDSAEIHLPKVIVNEADTHELVRDLIAGDEIAFETVVEDGKLALGALLAVFPGPIHTEPRRAGGDGPTRASECGPVLRALACIGQDAAGFVSVRTQDRDPVVRAWATRLLGELPCADAARTVARRVADTDPEVRRAALTAGRLFQSDASARTALRDALGGFAADALRNEDAAHAAIEMLADLRDPRGVPTLIELLTSPLADIVKSAQWALVVLCRQDFGREHARWQAWWKENAARHRIEWLIDSLNHDVADLRRAAGDELKSITREYFGYYDDLPAAEREKAQARYREWWDARGRQQFDD